jgi:DNA ligase D-like protein (predicted 3'-phosphoesterase)
MRYFAQTDGRKLLEEYRRKRNFRRTPEPAGATEHPARPEDEPVFVVQKHDASRLHYDFRLEVDGVLKSWAIPKGPSMNTRDKRLAVPTEDHPLEYRDFEGIIPEGEYGAGRVIVWDTGTFRNITKRDGQLVPLHQAIENGQVAIWLEGKKLKGGFALTRIRDGKKPIWLLVKKRDEYANTSDPVNEQAESVLSGRTTEELDEAHTAA